MQTFNRGRSFSGLISGLLTENKVLSKSYGGVRTEGTSAGSQKLQLVLETTRAMQFSKHPLCVALREKAL